MRCRALLAALLVSGAAFAAAPADAPVAIDVRAGDKAPADGVFIPAALAVEKAKKCTQAAAERDKYRDEVANGPLPSGSLLLGAGLVGLVVGAIVGGIAAAVARK